MKRNNYFKGSILLVSFGLLFFACDKKVESKTNYIFKAAPSKDVVASVGTEKILESEFIKGIENDLYEAEMKVYDIKFARLQAMLLEKFMAKDPNKKNLTNDEFLNQIIAKSIKVTDVEIEKFIKDRQIPKDQVNPEIRERIKQFIEMDAKKGAVEKWLALQTKNTPVEVYIPKPARPVFEVNVGEAPFKGASDAKVTIVEYSDFQCPFCSKAAVIVTELEKKYGKKIKIAFKNYPLPMHSQARMASEAALCANEQNVKFFWKMHDGMFADQTKLDKDSLIATAKKAGVKEADFKTCLDSEKFKTKIEEDIAQGQKIGIKSTPTFFVNGKLISGAQPIEVFSELIDEELAK